MTWSSQESPLRNREERCASGERPISQAVKESGPASGFAGAPTSGVTRREWLVAVPAAAVLMTSAQALATPDPTTYGAAGGLHSEFPSHDPDVVRELVAVSHVRIDRVSELVEASPALAKPPGIGASVTGKVRLAPHHTWAGVTSSSF